MERVIEVLRAELKSEIRVDHVSRCLYSTDASIYEVQPFAIFIPRSKSELVQALEICSRYAVHVIPRGGASGIAGGCLGSGLVVDTSIHLNRILHVDYANRYAVVQPGVVCDRLNELLAPHGLYFAPEISSSNRATLGGMIATNAAGANSLKIGKIQDHVLEIELALWNGETVHFSKLHKDTWKEKLKLRGSEGKIYRHLEHIRKEYAGDIAKDFPKTVRRASGYNLDALLKTEFTNVAELICGSEGTLGFITEIKLALTPLPQGSRLAVIGFKDLDSAFAAVDTCMQFGPSALELIDKKIIDAGRSSPSMRDKLHWLEGNPEALLLTEFDKSTRLKDSLQGYLFFNEIVDPETIKHVWALRRSGLGLLLSKRSYNRAIAFIEDVAVPPEQLSPFVTKLKALLAGFGKDVGIYGHVGAGCLHVRPFLDLRRPDELSLMQQIADQVGTLLLEHGGVYSGEHGDGLVRSWTTQKMFGPRLYEALCQVKHAFDPYGLMNPGKIVPSQTKTPQSLLEHLRLSPSTAINQFQTYMDFSREGGIELAVDLCNGNGQCRKKEGVMCPSFQVSHNEKDSTRGRAQALRSLIHGQLKDKEMFDEDFHEVMELCIQCKGCKTECPSQIDMAKMKSEYLYHLNKKKRPQLRERMFAHIADLFSWASKLSWLVNFINRLPFSHALLGKIGISTDRILPKMAAKRFSSLFKAHNNEANNPQVVLFVDSHTEFLTPHIGMAAVRVLEALKISVIAPAWKCCGRPLISKGFLPKAKKQLGEVLDMLYPYALKGYTIVGIEPSCLSAITDEIRDFGLDQEKLQLVLKAIKPLDQYLLSHKEALAKLVTPYEDDVLVHGHCHQKALFGMQHELDLLKHTVAPYLREIPSGCCGMAGTFGYEKEHSQFSKRIGELVLFPEIRAEPNALVIASGSSCRSQIEDGTQTKALHFVEFIASRLTPSY